MFSFLRNNSLVSAACKLLLVCLLQIVLGPELHAEKFEAQEAGPSINFRIQRNLESGKYSFTDLYEGAVILFDQGRYERAQVLFELASQLQPKNLTIFKYLAQIYEETGQSDRMARLAQSVSAFLLPEGEDDDFYEKMLTYSIVLNSRTNSEFAWNTFKRLADTLHFKPGRLREVVKNLERSVHLPFLGRVYSYMERRDLYEEFRWGQLGEYFLARGDQERAALYLNKALEQEGFDPRFLYSYALVLFNRRQFPECQIYINVARRLNDESRVLDRLAELQGSLSEYIYDVGPEQVRKEAELLFKFKRKRQAIERLEELLLLSPDNHKTYLEMGKLLLSYPSEYNTLEEGRDYLLKVADYEEASFSELFDVASLLNSKLLLDELAYVLQKIEKKYPRRSRSSLKLQEFRQSVIKELKKNIRLFEIHSSIPELKQYLRLLINFDETFLEAYLKLARTLQEEMIAQIKERKFVSPELKMEVNNYMLLLRDQGRKIFPREHKIYYYLGKLSTYFHDEKRNYSMEIAYFKNALELKEEAESRISLAEVYFDFGFYKRSISVLEQLDFAKLEESVRDRVDQLMVRNHVENARAAYSHGNHFLVIEHMQKALDINKKKLISRESTLWMAYSMFYGEQHENARKLLMQAHEFYGEDPEIFYLIALSFEGLYQLENAVIWYNRAIAIGKKEDLFIQECIKNRDNLENILKYQREEQEKAQSQ